MPTPRPIASRLRPALAVLLALFWVWSVGESAMHALESQHVVCDEHGVVEDLASTTVHGHDTPALSADADAPGDAHDACAHEVACRGGSAALVPPLPSALPPAAPLVLVRQASPVMVSDAPRGPPLLALAGKTSPPRLA